MPDTFEHFEESIQVHFSVEWCNQWKKHQKWLKANGVEVDGFEDNSVYKYLVEKYDLIGRYKASLIWKRMLEREEIGEAREYYMRKEAGVSLAFSEVSSYRAGIQNR